MNDPAATVLFIVAAWWFYQWATTWERCTCNTGIRHGL